MHIISIADLVRIMHDIDVIKGRVCSACGSYGPAPSGGFPACRRGYETAGHDDGCDGWQPKPPADAA